MIELFNDVNLAFKKNEFGQQKRYQRIRHKTETNFEDSKDKISLSKSPLRNPSLKINHTQENKFFQRKSVKNKFNNVLMRAQRG